MKVCVYGAGAIGGHLAGRLAKGGATVSVVARGAHLAAMQANGLRVHAPDGEIHAEVAASADPAALGVQDAVIVATKAPSLPDVAAGIGKLLGPETPVVFAMNGIPWFYFHGEGGPHDGMRLEKLDPGGALERAVGAARAVAGVVYSACSVPAPGVVEVEHSRNRLVIGPAEGAFARQTDALAATLQAGGITIERSERFRDAIWAKLLINMGAGPLAVLTASTGVAFFAEEACRDATRRVVQEGAAIVAAMGCSVTPDIEGRIANGSRSNHKSSILQDLELGRPMEIEALFGVPLDLARLYGVPTPTLDLLTALVRVRARAAGLYG